MYGVILDCMLTLLKFALGTLCVTTINTLDLNGVFYGNNKFLNYVQIGKLSLQI